MDMMTGGKQTEAARYNPEPCTACADRRSGSTGLPALRDEPLTVAPVVWGCGRAIFSFFLFFFHTTGFPSGRLISPAERMMNSVIMTAIR